MEGLLPVRENKDSPALADIRLKIVHELPVVCHVRLVVCKAASAVQKSLPFREIQKVPSTFLIHLALPYTISCIIICSR